MQKWPISLVVITLNEEKNIERCLRSVPFADDVVVLDSGSQDRTCEIAKNCGARVFSESFRGYYGQKVRATELAQHDWVLSLDADEALSSELQAEIIARLEGGLQADAYQCSRLSFYLGRWIYHGGWYPDPQIRLFHRLKAHWREGNVHERVEAEKMGRFAHPLHHWVFENLADQVSTNNEYSTLAAKELFGKGTRFSFLKLLLKPGLKFIETYLLKRGFLDGLPGFIIAVGAAYSMFLKYAKLWEMHKFSAPPKSRLTN